MCPKDGIPELETGSVCTVSIIMPCGVKSHTGNTSSVKEDWSTA